jgi:hypothetical protein
MWLLATHDCADEVDYDFRAEARRLAGAHD